MHEKIDSLIYKFLKVNHGSRKEKKNGYQEHIPFPFQQALSQFHKKRSMEVITNPVKELK
jgi:hypothetical protein